VTVLLGVVPRQSESRVEKIPRPRSGALIPSAESRAGSANAGAGGDPEGSAGRPAIRIANSARPIPATSVNRCPASASRARLFKMIPPTTSIKRNVSVMPETSRRRSRHLDAALV